MKATSFETKCQILSDLWLNYRDDGEFGDFIEFNDLALPLAYAFANEIIANTPKVNHLVEEAWKALLAEVQIEDEGFDGLDDFLTQAAR